MYDDDLLVTSASASDILAFKIGLSEKFDTRDLDDVTAFLNISTEHRRGSYVFSQRGYTSRMLETFNMSNCNPAATPMDPAQLYNLTERKERTANEARLMNHVPYCKLVGMLLYLSTHTRPDIAFSTGILTRNTSSPRPP